MDSSPISQTQPAELSTEPEQGSKEELLGYSNKLKRQDEAKSQPS
jgi:hypothetical protein